MTTTHPAPRSSRAATLRLLCAASLLFACGEKREPPAPANEELDQLRANEEASLTAYLQVDKEGHFQVPVKQAIETVAKNPKLLEPLVELPDPDEMTPLQRGKYHFENTYACAGCHALDGTVKKAPSLKARWGGPPSEISTGEKIPFTDEYFKESVLYSQAKIVKGFPPIMPLFNGKIPEKDLNEIREYLKSL
jgi:hypothetical protein